MAKKKVLIIEDHRPQGLALTEALQARGFEVYYASLVAEARELGAEHWKDIDVAVLDMRMDQDPDNQGVTGAEIAIDLRNASREFPPEFLIYSAYSEIPYYKLALKLGVAAYLSKEGESGKVSNNLIEAIRHVRILALRRALNSDNPATSDRVARITTQSQDEPEAIVRFCQEVLKPEFESCLGAPFVILFSEADKMAENCADSAGLPPGSSKYYDTLQALTHGIGNPTEPFVLNIGELKKQTDFDADQSYEKLDGAAFVPLPISQKYKLSIGILQERASDARLADGTERPVEDAKALSTILAQYLRPTVLENMLKIWPRWTELKAIRSSVAKLCLFVGQELKYMLPEKDSGEQPWPGDSLRRLWDLAGDLNNTGQLLRELGSWRRGDECELVSVKEVADMSWRLITRGEEDEGRGFKVEGDCGVEADRRDLSIAVSRLLHWLAQRRPSTPEGEEPFVMVTCRDEAGSPTIVFEDKSQRLNKKLRAEMFMPFAQAVPVPFSSEAQGDAPEGAAADGEAGSREGRPEGRYLPLYLAMMLVEGRYHGTLRDHSDDPDLKDRTYGHRIVMQFPPIGKTV